MKLNKMKIAVAALLLVLSAAGCDDSKKSKDDIGVSPQGNNQTCAETPNACIVGEQRAEGFYLASAASDTDLGKNKIMQIRVAFFGSKAKGRSIPVSMKGYLVIQRLGSVDRDSQYSDMDGEYVFGGGDEEEHDQDDLGPVYAEEDNDDDIQFLPSLNGKAGVWTIVTAEEGRYVRSIREVVDSKGNEMTITSGRVQIKDIRVEIHGGNDHVLAKFTGSINTNFKNATGYSELRGKLTFYRTNNSGNERVINDIEL